MDGRGEATLTKTSSFVLEDLVKHSNTVEYIIHRSLSVPEQHAPPEGQPGARTTAKTLGIPMP